MKLKQNKTGLLSLGISLFAAAVIGIMQVITPMASAASRYYCGSQCNNKSSSWTIPSNGVKCSNSQKLVAQGYPKGYTAYGGSHGLNDPNMKVKVYYSTVCQTIWATATNDNAVAITNQGECGLFTDLLLAKYNNTYISTVTCPARGKTVTSRMADDHSPTYGKAVKIEFNEPNRTGYATYEFSY